LRGDWRGEEVNGLLVICEGRARAVTPDAALEASSGILSKLDSLELELKPPVFLTAALFRAGFERGEWGRRGGFDKAAAAG
jgi:hypothetical protein